jgi:tetratricopeptide (TPR) repeat protein
LCVSSAGITHEGNAGIFLVLESIMSNLKFVSVICLMVATLSACSSDPQATAREHFERGEQQQAQNKINEAIIEYRRAIQSDPRLGPARLRLADAYVQNGDRGNALREYVRAAELLPDDEDVQLKAGKMMLMAGQFADARGLGERLLARSPKSVEAQILIANSLAGLQDLESAIDAFEKAVQIDPNRAATYAELGAVQVAKGDLAAAEAAFRKAVEIDPQSQAAVISLANFVWSRGDADQGEQLMKRALELDPKNLVVNRSLAMFYLVRRRPEAAEPYLKTVAEASTDPRAKYALADYYLRLRRFDDARDLVTPFVKDDKTFVDSSIMLARIEATDGKMAEAHRILDGVLAREPKHVEALLVRGQLFLAENNSVNALTALQTATAGNPNSVAAHVALAQTHQLRGSVKEAMKSFNDALRIEPNNNYARLALANLQVNTGAAADAVPLLMKVVGENPRNLEAKLLLLRGFIAVDDMPQADALAADLQKTNGDSASVQTALGMLATHKKDAAAARQAYGRALSANPRSYQALAGLLTAELQGKNFGAVRALIDKQLAQNPNDPHLNLMAAQAYDVLGDAFEMEKALKKTVEADPHSLDAYAMLGKMYYQQGRLDLARIELERYVATAPASVPGNTMLGTILDLQGKKKEARARYNRALQIDSRAAVAANNAAWIDANTDGSNLDMALQLAQTAKSQLPNQHEIDDTLGWIYYKKNMPTRAIESLENSTLKSPQNATYAYHLGLAYHQNGDAAQARKELERALKLKPDFEGAAHAKQVLESIRE